MKKVSSEENKDQTTIEKTVFVFVGFVGFILVFASLGGQDSFRTERLRAGVGYFSESGLSLTNQDFFDTYMPYFEYFSRK